MTLKECSRWAGRFAVLCVVAFATVSPASAAWKEKVLYSFQNIPDGAVPVGNIVFDKAGNLYGVTEWAGADNCPGTTQCGIVYQLQPPAKKGQSWTENILYTFKGKGANDGAGPQGGVMFDAAGNLYGTTAYGGAGNCVLLGTTVGCGTVFELSPPQQQGGAWTETVLYSFQGNTDGYIPHDDLIFDEQGNIYGATLFGGGLGDCNPFYGFCGTVYQLIRPRTKGGVWTEHVLYSFRGTGLDTVAGDGANPNGGLIFDSKGAIYGTTNAGGSSITICGNTAPLGCGTVFKLVPPQKKGEAWMEQILHFFVHTDGARSYAGMVFDQRGNLFGTTAGGGSGDSGLVFELMVPTKQDEPWKENFLHVFGLKGTSDGGFPRAKLISDSAGRLYGTAWGGKAPYGVVFRLTPGKGKQWSFSVLYNFQGPPDGYSPTASLVFDKKGHAYSPTANGGAGCQGGCGTVFEIWP